MVGSGVVVVSPVLYPDSIPGDEKSNWVELLTSFKGRERGKVSSIFLIQRQQSKGLS